MQLDQSCLGCSPHHLFQHVTGMFIVILRWLTLHFACLQLVVAISHYMADGQLGGTTSSCHINECLTALFAFPVREADRPTSQNVPQAGQAFSNIIVGVVHLTDTASCHELLSTYMLSAEDVKVGLRPIVAHTFGMESLMCYPGSNCHLVERSLLNLQNQTFLTNQSCLASPLTRELEGSLQHEYRPQDLQKLEPCNSTEKLTASAAAIWHGTLSQADMPRTDDAFSSQQAAPAAQIQLGY